MKENSTFYLKQTAKISNFRMAKRAALELEFFPKQVEFFGDYFLTIYRNFNNNEAHTFCSNVVPYVDIFEKNGKPLSRIDVG